MTGKKNTTPQKRRNTPSSKGEPKQRKTVSSQKKPLSEPLDKKQTEAKKKASQENKSKEKNNSPRRRGIPPNYESNKKPTRKQPAKKIKEKETIRTPDYDMEKIKAIGKSKGVELTPKEGIRLNRFIANSGVCSRRQADKYIASGRVTVNGQVITEMGYRVKPTDKVALDGEVLKRERLVYVLLNKPKGYITTTDDPKARKTVMELVADACKERIYPVGRLDRNTTGLLLLTNDGALAERLSHPSNEVRKNYQLELDKPLLEEHFNQIVRGIYLEDGFIKPDKMEYITGDRKIISIDIHSGRNRIVRRIFEHFGYKILRLDRAMYAGLTKKGLPRGRWRYLTQQEVIRLKFFTGKSKKWLKKEETAQSPVPEE
ncbi:MAG: pseudouridine synthase [Cytophagales bacterium]|nr:rRNA pseudouridine synthase [Bernardetiaceae bacterium]MDW8211536.1 pseudouridine synthase [Cytophagales bacterium]